MRREHFEEQQPISHPTDAQAPPSVISWAVHKDAPTSGPILVIAAESLVNAQRQNTINGEIHRAATVEECAPKLVQQVINIENWTFRSATNPLTTDQVTCLIHIPANVRGQGQPEQLYLQPMTRDKDGKVVADGKPVPISTKLMEPLVLQTLEQMSQDQSVKIPPYQADVKWLPLVETDIKFTLEGSSESSIIRVSEVRSATGTERDKIILHDRFDAKGPSVMDDPARDECIRLFCAQAQTKPDSVDWYVRDQDGKLHEVSITYVQVKQENPAFTHWDQRGEFNIHTREEAKTRFPDITVEVPRTSIKPVEPGQSGPLSAALTEASQRQIIAQERLQSTPQHNLVQEHFPSR